METLLKSLPEENKTYLSSIIDRIKKETSLLSISLSTVDKTRRTFKNKITFNLLFGIEEIKLKKYDEELWGTLDQESKDKMTSILDNQQKQLNYCQDLALQIETLLFLENKEKITDAYKKKLFELCLSLQALKNTPLRAKILFGIIKYDQLIKMGEEELAPPDQQEKLKEQRKKFFKEQMFLTEETKVINHKEVTSNTLITKEINDENNNTFDVLKYNSKPSSGSIKPKKEININDSGNIKNTSGDKPVVKEKSKIAGLSSDMIKFYFEIDNLRKEWLDKNIDDIIKGNLKKTTVDEIIEKRKQFNVNL